MVESITVITLLLSALDRIDLQAIVDRDPHESRRTALPGARLVKVLVGLSDDPHGEIAGADPDPHRTPRSAKGSGREGGPQYLVQWDARAGCWADGRGLDGGCADVRAMA